MSTSPSRWMTIGEFLLRRLEEAGLSHLFGVPGDFNLELLQQLEDAGKLTWVGTCGELNASYAAIERSTGRSSSSQSRRRVSPWRTSTCGRQPIASVSRR